MNSVENEDEEEESKIHATWSSSRNLPRKIHLEGCIKRDLLRSPRQRSAAIYFRKQRANLTREHSSWMHKHVCVPLTAFAIHGYSWKYREKLFHGKGPPVVRRCLLFTLKVARYSRNDSRILNYEEHQFLPRVVSLDRTFCLFICLIISRENRRDFKGYQFLARSKNERGKFFSIFNFNLIFYPLPENPVDART